MFLSDRNRLVVLSKCTNEVHTSSLLDAHQSQTKIYIVFSCIKRWRTYVVGDHSFRIAAEIRMPCTFVLFCFRKTFCKLLKHTSLFGIHVRQHIFRSLKFFKVTAAASNAIDMDSIDISLLQVWSGLVKKHCKQKSRPWRVRGTTNLV